MSYNKDWLQYYLPLNSLDDLEIGMMVKYIRKLEDGFIEKKTGGMVVSINIENKIIKIRKIPGKYKPYALKIRDNIELYYRYRSLPRILQNFSNIVGGVKNVNASIKMFGETESEINQNLYYIYKKYNGSITDLIMTVRKLTKENKQLGGKEYLRNSFKNVKDITSNTLSSTLSETYEDKRNNDEKNIFIKNKNNQYYLPKFNSLDNKHKSKYKLFDTNISETSTEKSIFINENIFNNKDDTTVSFDTYSISKI